ncbi:geranylgeranylglyceryl phosphate synthase-like protein [Natrialba hulunbeirensis JCM 10989]|uniref:phosphoglycerol geranylgeranyltransferase n=1 Tax=Natrialba hulunbeirensis JCM 10989 TaxID=1227493 RepID=L9ZT74_9EURY|nr:heptaprenylglyceryl phosphate synthase [Natrialba hulunbeirensis]ELY89539.1 geranylgeranylglyceryl phosphate synthase-like protein [Natrialba hulunbeirensis JCM 10989]
MDIPWTDIRHVTKVDPAKPLPDDAGVIADTDLVIVGGSDDVTESNTLEAIQSISRLAPDVPIFQEPYSAEQVSTDTLDAVDYLSVPAVYNGDRDNFVGKHLDLFAEIARKPDELTGSSVPLVGDLITSKGVDAVERLATKLIGEGYVVQHVDSAAAGVSGVETAYTSEQVAGAALATEMFYDFPIFYVEYSGTYGGPEDVKAAARYLDETVLLYGGGIDSAAKTTEILEAGADAVVVGDCYHDDPALYQRTIPGQ